ncbi:hypothetical protein ACFLZG_05825 [Thermodesulfobacteriota bacterium]
MAIDYIKEAEKYRPEVIKTLLVGEAPPPNGQTYFYLPKELNNTTSIQNDRSLPATIFCHYFGKRPEGLTEYIQFLNALKNIGVFLVDIYDEPIVVRGSHEGEQKIVEAIPKLYTKLQERGIDMKAQQTIFLLARNSYAKHIRRHFPYAERITWKKFRMENGEKTP